MSDDVKDPIREEARCTGHCCRSFFLPATPSELAWQGELHAMAERGEPLPEGARLFRDGPQIAGMVVHLGAFHRNPIGDSRAATMSEPGNFYRCRNLLANGDCAIYSRRPWMCRVYPRDSVCEYASCTRRCGEDVDAGEPVAEVVGG